MTDQNAMHKAIRVDFDEDAADAFVGTVTHIRDANGNIIRTDFDDDGDGFVERIHFDPDADGYVDRVEIYAWDAGYTGWEHFTGGASLAAIDISGSSFRPAFADVDSDGDLDLVVDSSAGDLHYFENTGGAKAPVFSERTGADLNPFHGIGVEIVDEAPAFADLDGDGDLDLVVGERLGSVRYYENTGTATSPAFTERAGNPDINPFHGISVASPNRRKAKSVPTFADLDDDGDLDLVVGNLLGNVYYYENTGTAAAPTFMKRENDANPLHGIAVRREAAPTFADLDGDGDLDLVVGAGVGVHYFENTGSAAAPAFAKLEGFANPFAGFNPTAYYKPAFADLDGDQSLEFIFGSVDTELLYYQPAPAVLVRNEVYTRDVDGNIIRSEFEFDDDGDGAADRIEIRVRDVGGNIIRSEFDDDGDGAADRIEIHARDVDGNIIRSEFDDDGDGAADRIEIHARDADGNIIRSEFDDDGDGAADRIEIHARDADGNVIRSEFDDDGDGAADRAEIYARWGSDAAPVERTGFDDNADGVVDRVEIRGRWYTDSGVPVVRVSYHDDADGFEDRSEYYAHGRLVYTSTYLRYPGDAQPLLAQRIYEPGVVGSRTSVEVYSRIWFEDGGGVFRGVFRTDTDHFADGTIDSTSGHVITCDGPDCRVSSLPRLRSTSGKKIRNYFDDDADGTVDRVEVYVWDANGDIFGIYHDDGVDWTVDRGAFDETGDGTVDRLETYAYDARGWLIKKVVVRSEDEDDAGGASAEDPGFENGGGNNPGRSASGGSYARGAGRTTRPDDEVGAHTPSEPMLYDMRGDAIVRSETYVRNAAGDVVRTDYDEGNDGTIERSSFDDAGDGVVDRTETYVHNVAGDVVRTDFDEGDDGTIERSSFDDAGDGVVDRSETYARNAAGDVVRTDYDEGNDGTVERSSFDDAGDGVVDRTETYVRNAAGDVVRVEVEQDDDDLVDEYRYDHDANGRIDWVGHDSDNDGMLERLEFRGQWGVAGNPVVHTILLLGEGSAYTVAFHDGDGGQLASGWNHTGPGALDGFAYSAGLAVVSELQTAATAGSAGATLPVDAVLLAGVPQIDLAGAGIGNTDLTISTGALAVLARGDAAYQLRIDGDGDDVLRFDLDDFTAGDAVAVGGENYLQYRGTTGSFIVDSDVILVAA